MARHPGGERYRLELEALADDGTRCTSGSGRRSSACCAAFRLRCRTVAEVTPRQLPESDPAPDPPERLDPP